MIRFSRKSIRQIDDLLDHYEAKGRPEAADNLLRVVEVAASRIAAAPQDGLAAPRPYPELARAGRRWIKQGSYWLAYLPDDGPTIIGIYHDGSDIPGRI